MANENLFSGILNGLAAVQMQKFQRAQEAFQKNQELQQKMKENEMFYQQAEQRRPAEFRRKLEEQKQLKIQDSQIDQDIMGEIRQRKIRESLGTIGPDGKWQGGQFSDLANKNPAWAKRLIGSMHGIEIPNESTVSPEIAKLVEGNLTKENFHKAFTMAKTPEDREYLKSMLLIDKQFSKQFMPIHGNGFVGAFNPETGKTEFTSTAQYSQSAHAGGGGVSARNIQKREIRDEKGKVVGAKWIDVTTGKEVDQTGKPVGGGWMSNLFERFFGPPQPQEIDMDDYKQTRSIVDRLARQGELTPLDPEDKQLYKEASEKLRNYDRQLLSKNKVSTTSAASAQKAVISDSEKTGGNPGGTDLPDPGPKTGVYDDRLDRIMKEKAKPRNDRADRMWNEGGPRW